MSVSIKQLADLDFAGVSKLLNLPTPVDAGDVTTKSFVEAAIDKAVAGTSYQSDVKNVQTDATLDPTATPVLGDRYILTNVAALHADFGTITGVVNGDIVEFNGTAFVVEYSPAIKGDGALVYSTAAKDFYRFVNGAWISGGFTTVNSGKGIVNNAGAFDVNVDGVTVEVNASNEVAVIDGLFAKKRTAKIGDGTATTFTLTHSLNTNDVIVKVYSNVAPFEDVEGVAVERPDLNSVKLSLNVAPTTDQYKVVILG